MTITTTTTTTTRKYSPYPTIKYPSDFEFFDKHPGHCSTVCISKDGHTLLKQPVQFYEDEGPKVTAGHRRRAEESALFLERETAIYQHLGTHPNVLSVLEYREDGSLLFPYLRNGQLREHLKTVEASASQRKAWMEAAARSLAFVHSRQVLVADISARNFLLTDDLTLVLCDFSGSGLGDLESMVAPDFRGEKPRPDTNAPFTISTEIFALGSLLYEIATSKQPYAELENEQVTARYRSGDFPSTSDILCGSVIRGCWEGQFETCEEVLRAIQESEAV